MRIEVLESAFDPWQEVLEHESSLTPGSFGATAVFVGTMRDMNEGDAVTRMTLEHYAGMTEEHLAQAAHQVQADHETVDVVILHRIGDIAPGDPIVLVGVWSKHRAEAFEACEKLVEYLKSQAPFWKKEQLSDGANRWVEHNTPGPKGAVK
ncbi:MAG: molybdenum cofactor biosynthesis protein MoaE [Acidiferrobacterales bacterium]|nr:molybdenum cofactor biosynthesis protein MoaE [Acidiferrobacterales bacterium]